MGIHGLKKFIRTKFPETIKTIELSELNGKKIAVDIASELYACKISCQGRGNWINMLLGYLKSFKRANIHATFIFDGKPPLEKLFEQQRRNQQRDKTVCDSIQLNCDLNIYKQNSTITPLLQSVATRIAAKTSNTHITRLLNRTQTQPDKSCIRVEEIEEYIEKKTNQSAGVTRQDVAETKELLTLLGIPWIQAPGEAEALCCNLVARNQACGVLTEDTDVLTYGSCLFICDLDVKNSTCNVFDLNKLLEQLDFSMTTFQDFCIMCKCDYNSNLPKIGIISSWKLMQQYKSIDELIQAQPEHDYSVLIHERCRELFTTWGDLQDAHLYNTSWWNPNIDFDKLFSWFQLHNVRFNQSTIYTEWTSPQITFE